MADPERFLKDPVAVLKQAGVELTQEHEAQLKPDDDPDADPDPRPRLRQACRRSNLLDLRLEGSESWDGDDSAGDERHRDRSDLRLLR